MTENSQIESELNECEKKFLTMFRDSPLVLTLTSAKDHRYVEVNDTFERITGWNRDEVIGRTPFDIGIWVDPSDRVDLVRRLVSGAVIRNLAVRARMKNGENRMGSASAALIEINGELCVLSLITDITELKRAKAAQRESEERFRLIANAAPVMIWMSGADSLCTYFNQCWLDFTGRPFEKEIGNGWAEGVHRDDLERCLDAYKRAFDRRAPYQVEYRLRRHDGEYRWILVSGVPRFDIDSSFVGYIGAAMDVDEGKLSEAGFSSLGRRLIQGQDKERLELAHELHDFVERLMVPLIDLDRLRQNPPESVAVCSREVGEARQQLENLASDIQRLSYRVHSAKLEYLGLAVAAASFCKELSDQKKIAIDYASEGIPRGLPQGISLCLFRVLQEALQNATSYSTSQHLQVLLSYGPNEVYLRVRDSGIGFDPQEALRGPGLGLSIMKERLKMVNGELSIQSQRERGTTIHARVPLNPEIYSHGARDQ